MPEQNQITLSYGLDLVSVVFGVTLTLLANWVRDKFKWDRGKKERDKLVFSALASELSFNLAIAGKFKNEDVGIYEPIPIFFSVSAWGTYSGEANAVSK